MILPARLLARMFVWVHNLPQTVEMRQPAPTVVGTFFGYPQVRRGAIVPPFQVF
jgi:hypothetical protein